MKQIMLILIVTVFSITVSTAEGSTDFDMLVAITRQNPEMDWWFVVPPEFGNKGDVPYGDTPGAPILAT